MTFAAPWILSALVLLPLLWWLLRVTPPAPRRQRFPAVRLLRDLIPTEETSARTPWWLLALRLLAAALVIVGLAGPVRGTGSLPLGTGPALLVIDNGWASAADWNARLGAANAALDRIGRAGRRVAVLATAPGAAGEPLAVSAPMPPHDARARLAALHPEPWPAENDRAAALVRAWPHKGGVVYVATGLAPERASGQALARALAAHGPLTEIAPRVPAARILLPPKLEHGRLVARVAQLPVAVPEEATLLAEAPGGRVLARFTVPIPAGAHEAERVVPLPLEVANRLSAFRLAGVTSAAGVVLLDARWRRRPVGLVSSDPTAADLPFVGDLYYLKRALAPFAELREGDLTNLLHGSLAVIVLADRVLTASSEQAALREWVEKGGVLIRFAGPLLAAHPDPLLPVKLIAGERALGGALSWGEPEHLAPFPEDSPFAGLEVPADVTVHRQVLAEPSVDLGAHTWARLTDGTPLVTEAPLGAGRIVLVHVTANAAWSNLPLSGLFVSMMRRLVALSAGVAGNEGNAALHPAEVLNGFGTLEPPSAAARALTPKRIAAALMPSPEHPPGLYGPENERRALNLTAALAPLARAAPIAGSHAETLAGFTRERDLGPSLLAAAFALFALDLVIALALRGLLGRRGPGHAAAALALAAALSSVPLGARAATVPSAALTTELAYVVTGDSAVDTLSLEGLEGLGAFVNARTAITLGKPQGVVLGTDDLSLYPLLYWPVTAAAKALSPQAIVALNRFMGDGGIILIDTEGSDIGAAGSGAGFAPGAAAALKRIASGLAVPPLTTLTYENLLAHTFYLLREFPGRFVGAPIWLARDPSNRNDNVSPVIIGANDWAAAWAIDSNGDYPYSTLPGGAQQRLLAYRFGVNVVMYALTGNYKGDQVHLPAILERLGQ